MKKIYLIFIISLLLPACSLKGAYVIRLKEVSISGQTAPESTIYSAKAKKNWQETGYIFYGYEDEIINTNWIISNNAFYCIIENCSNSDLEILWDDTKYIEYDNNKAASKILPTEHSNMETKPPPDAQQQSAVIKKSQKIKEMIMPVDENGKPYKIMSSFGKTFKYVGKMFGVRMPIRFQNKTFEYSFIFSIDDSAY
jgi:hypothetical protein